MGGWVVDVSDGVDKNNEIFTSKHQEEDNDKNLNSDTEGWDGDVSGEEDDSSESDTYKAQMMDSIEDENEDNVAREEDESDTCQGKELNNIEDEGMAGDDGYEADEEAEWIGELQSTGSAYRFWYWHAFLT